MTIRPAKPEDVPHVLPMVDKTCALHESFDPAKYSFLEEPGAMYHNWLTTRAKDPRSVFLVAEADDNLIGFLVGTVEREIPIYRLEEFGFIHDLWIDEGYRHEGIGRQLVMIAIEKFKEIGVEQIRLDTAMKNEPARNLFAACGFRPSIIEMILELKSE